MAWNDLPRCLTKQLNYLFRREYLYDLAASPYSRYAAQSRGGDMRLHFTGLSHIDLTTLCTHTDTHTNTCLTLCPWFWHLYHLWLSFFPPSSHYALLMFQIAELLKMHSIRWDFFSFSDCNTEDTHHAFCSSSCLPLSTLHHSLSSLPYLDLR